MNRSEVAKVFAYACFFDGRLQADEGKILAWDAALIPEITFEFAKYFVAVHYMKEDKVIAPVHINKAWEREVAHQKEMERSKRIGIEFDEAMAKAAPPEVVDKYLTEIREKLAKGKSSADMADGDGKVASDL